MKVFVVPKPVVLVVPCDDGLEKRAKPRGEVCLCPAYYTREAALAAFPNSETVEMTMESDWVHHIVCDIRNGVNE